jgi:hypothetical protein
MIRKTPRGVGDLFARFGASLRKELVLFGKAPGAAGYFNDNPLIGSLFDQCSRKRPNLRKQRRNVALAPRISALSFAG